VEKSSVPEPSQDRETSGEAGYEQPTIVVSAGIFEASRAFY
jgi:hypothetical protein